MNECSICGSEAATKEYTDHRNIVTTDCPICGTYTMSVAVEKFCSSLRSEARSIALLSHVIRKSQPQKINLTREDVTNILKNSHLPNIIEQSNNLVLFIGDTLVKLGAGDAFSINASHRAVVGSLNEDEFKFILQSFYENRLVSYNGLSFTGEMYVSFPFPTTLTMVGWEQYYRLKHEQVDSRIAFMAMQYGDATLDKLFNTCFKPAVKETGFDLVRLDQQPKAGLIDDRLRVEIRNARFVIADLTHYNAGAYWEAGFAEGLGRPVIYTCEKSVFGKKGTHFDTNHHLTVIWDEQDVAQAVNDLKATIRATLPGEARMMDR